MQSSAAFDRIASQYDRTWTAAPDGRRQRDAVWRNIAGCFHRGDRVLDLGCGTGEDALWLISRGIDVTAIDASGEMVRQARGRGVDARHLPLEELDSIPGVFDGAISNFGPLNCIASPETLRATLAAHIGPGGSLAICVIGRFCLRETLSFLLRGRIRKAARRWGGKARAESLDIEVFYHSIRSLRRAFAPEFSLESVVGIGATHRRIERLPFFRALADHRLLIFVRK